ncbi:ArsR family transcriptional regulator [Halorubellus sp. JP-L1]|uniref:helix-turn-helix transcriptional regulator n=1 Tax=Halorubellus sp. JP-L1 TaxID=2715753 RepID=UPI001408808E|nr:helix-turn-helix domain-containing protein [Halorubellus sp. JP-L1]NHN40771.1 ArsR family transcriptional regulator [Halorubellus sp. JP-L1]
MDSGERDDLVGTLTRRREILGALDERPRDKPALVRELGVARSTVDRAVRQLESCGLAERGPDGIELTTCGEVALDVYGAFTARLEALWECHDVVSQLPSREFAPPVFLADADVVRASVSAPDRPIMAFVDLVEEATYARGFSPAAYGAYVDAFERRVTAGELTAELAFSDEALTELTTTHRDAIERAASTGRVTVHRVETLPTAGVVVLERGDAGPVVAMGVHDGSSLSAVVTNDAPDAVAWARDFVDEQFERADPIPL